MVYAFIVLALLAGSIFGFIAIGSGSSSASGGTASVTISGTSPCVLASNSPKSMRSQLRPLTFGAVTKFLLPSPGRSPNAITVAHDGSVWFGEMALPGVGHLFSNGTLIEYQWPFNYTEPGGDCSSKTFTWGVALWNGMVWASDTAGNQLVGLNPTNGSVVTAKIPTNQSFPYALTTAPDNESLWFPEIEASRLGQLSLNGTITEHIVANGKGTAAQVVFANSALGYCVNVGGVPGKAPPSVFSFIPDHFASSQAEIGGNTTLYSPDSIALGRGGLWLAQHGASSVIFYSFRDRNWTIYPDIDGELRRYDSSILRGDHGSQGLVQRALREQDGSVRP